VVYYIGIIVFIKSVDEDSRYNLAGTSREERPWAESCSVPVMRHFTSEPDFSIPVGPLSPRVPVFLYRNLGGTAELLPRPCFMGGGFFVSPRISHICKLIFSEVKQ